MKVLIYGVNNQEIDSRGKKDHRFFFFMQNSPDDEFIILFKVLKKA